MAGRRLSVVIGPDPPPRLDKALARDAPEAAHLSRSRLARLIAGGGVSRDGVALDSPRARVSAGDEIRLEIPAEAATGMAPEDIALCILHEDDDLIVVDKPAGMVVHPAPGSPAGTLVNALLHHCGESLSGVGGERRPGIVHRIDKETSGLLVVAKTDRAHHGLAAQFAAHTAERAYRAVCHGVPSAADPRLLGLRGVEAEPDGAIRIVTNLARHPADRQRQAVTFGAGRHAVTRLRLVRDWGEAALLECRLETGRTHQIRAHLRHAGHALVGDPVYGGARRASERRLGACRAAAVNGFPRQALHAARLGFRHPASGHILCFDSELPADMQALIEALDADRDDTFA